MHLYVLGPPVQSKKCVQVCMCGGGGIFSVSAGGGQNLLVYCVLGGHDL